jgi:mono/diheme cytochrome c family protein
MRHSLIFVLFLAAELGITQAFGHTIGANAGNVENGKKLFVADGCYQCHGRQGQGGSSAPVGSYAPRLAPPKIPLEALRIYVRHPSGGMPPYTSKVLSDFEINDIYAFLKSIPAPPEVKDIPLLNEQ